MKELIKKKFPNLSKRLARVYNHLVHLQFYHKSIDAVFSDIYHRNHWANEESFSGPGSSIEKTLSIRKTIPQILSQYSVATVLDIPCGDFNWMKEVDLKNIKYIGMEIVKELVNKNNAAYASTHRSFAYADITNSALPKADLIICRDCLVHFSYHDIYKAIENIKQSGSSYLLTTTFPNHSNHDIVTGNWRPVNLIDKPFFLGKPLLIISENEVGDNEDKSLALWKVSEIRINRE